MINVTFGGKTRVPFRLVRDGDTFVRNGEYSDMIYRKLSSDQIDILRGIYNAATVGVNSIVLVRISDNEPVWLVNVNIEFSFR